MDNTPYIELPLLSSQPALDGFIVQVAGLNGEKVENKIELRGGNIYPLSGHADKFIVIPIFPPLFYNGSLRYQGSHLKWFIDSDRNIYIIDFSGNSAVLINGAWVYLSTPSFVSSINACISFFEWLESEVKRVGKDDTLVQVLIAIHDEDASYLPPWLTALSSFAEKWSEYKAHYKNLCLVRQGAVGR